MARPTDPSAAGPAGIGRLTFAPLAGHPGLRGLVAAWLRSEWPAWYGPAGPGQADDDVARYGRAHGLPHGLLAFADGRPCAFGVLKPDAVPGFEGRGPWLGAGYVEPALRGRGIGLALVQALQDEAARLGHERLWCATSTAPSLLQRAGWHRAGSSVLGGADVAVFESPPLAMPPPPG